MTIDRNQIFSSAPAPADPTAPAPAASAAAPTATEVAPLLNVQQTIEIPPAPPKTAIATLLVTEQGDDYAIHLLSDDVPGRRYVIRRPDKDMVQLTSAEAMQTYLALLRQVPEVANDGGVPQAPFLQLASWLKKVRAKTGEQLALVIREHTRTGVPWEMVQVQGTHLGAFVTAVRWGTYAGLDDEERELDLSSHSTSGGVLAHPDVVPAVCPLTQPQRDTLRRHLADVAMFATKRSATLDAWNKEIRQGLAGVGLVYVLCHAEWETPDKAHLADVATGEKLAFNTLIRDRAPVQPVVFLNACGSGLAKEDCDFLPARQLMGFAVPFLQRGAAAVIGTISTVYLSHAAEIAKQLMTLARNESKPLAVILRDIRRDAVAQYEAAKQSGDATAVDRALARWFYAFHYILFGSPTMRLELT